MSAITVISNSYQWTSPTGGAWASAGLWADQTTGQTPSPNAPGAADTAWLESFASTLTTAISGDGAAGAVYVDGAGTGVELAGQFEFGSLSVLSSQALALDSYSGGYLGLSSLGVTGAVDLGSGSLFIGGGTMTVGGALTGAGANALTVNYGDDIGAASSFSIALGVLDAGSLSLPGGAIVLNGGSLAVSGNASLGGATVTLEGPASFTVGGATDSGSGFSVTATGDGGSSATLGGGSVADTSIVQLGGSQFTVTGLAADAYSSIELGSVGGAALGAITVDPGVTLAASGSLNANYIVDNGVILVAAGQSLTLGGDAASYASYGRFGPRVANFIDGLTGDGQVSIGADAILTVDSAATNSANTIAFAGAGGTLAIYDTQASPVVFAATISGFQAGDAIDISRAIDTASFANGVLTLSDAGAIVAKLNLSGSYAGATFTLAAGPVNSAAASVLGSTAIRIAVPTTYTVAQFLAAQPALDAAGDILISDAAANVAANLAALNADGNIASIALTDLTTPSLALTAAQALANSKALGEITTPYTLVIADAAAQIQALTPGQIATLAAEKTVEIETSDVAPSLTVAQKAALGAAAIVLQQPYAAGSFENVTFNADGTLKEIDCYGVTGQPFTRFDLVYGASNRLASETLLNGATLYETESWGADGSYDQRVYAAGSAWGLSYASYENGYAASGVRDLQAWYDASGNLLGSETLQANGAYSLTLNGALYQVKTVNADGSYDIRAYVAGSAWGESYASYDNAYTAAGALSAQSWSDASGNVLASKSLGANGGYTLMLNGALSQVKTVDADGAYQLDNYGITGQPYTSDEIVYRSSGVVAALAADNSAGAGRLTLYGANDAVSVGPAQLSVAVGADIFAVNPHATEVIAASASSGDTFVFAPASGPNQTAWQDTLSGFVATGASADTLQFSASAFSAGPTAANQIADWQTVLAHTTQNTAGSAVITDIYGDALTLTGVTKAMLTPPPSL